MMSLSLTFGITTIVCGLGLGCLMFISRSSTSQQDPRDRR